MEPPPSTPPISPVAVLAVRILTFVFLLLSLIVLITTTTSKIKFFHLKAYRYLAATTILGLVYTLLQTAFAISQVCNRNRSGGARFYQFSFFGDKVVSYFLASGAATSFGATSVLKALFHVHIEADNFINKAYVDNFINKAYVATRLCFTGFIFAAVSSVFSSYALPKRG